MAPWAELTAVVDAAAAAHARGEVPVLATLIDAEGSTYRRAGARLLLSGAGQEVGMISGGCVEVDLRERVRAVVALGKPQLVTYDTRKSRDLIFGSGSGCPGAMEVLLEPLRTEPPYFAALRRWREGAADGWLATVASAPGLASLEVGDHLAWSDGDPGMAATGREAALRRLLERQGGSLPGSGGVLSVTLPAGGTARVLLERLSPRRLVVFGEGPDGGPVVRLARQLGWHVTQVHWRAIRDARELQDAHRTVQARPGETVRGLPMAPQTAVVIMTHHYLRDRMLLAQVMAGPARYVGLLGPRARAAQMCRELAGEGAAVDMDRLFAPIGLDLGAETPEEIAMSILAEITAVLAGRRPCSLRERAGKIHRGRLEAVKASPA